MTERSKAPTPFLHPPDSEAKVAEGSTHKPVLFTMALCLVILLTVTAAVVWILPNKRPTLPEAIEAGPPHTQPAPNRLQNEEEQEVQGLLKKWLALQVAAEADNVALWGQDDYALVRKTVAEADDALQRHAFEEAKIKYGSAVEKLQELISQKQLILKIAIEEADTALLENNSTAAAELYQRALAIDPDNGEALKGAQRAAARGEVNALLAEALEREQAGELSSALAVLTKLLSLDGEYTPALKARERIVALINDAEFQKAMTLFLYSLENNDLKAARRAHEQAKMLRGNNTAVAYASRRLAEAEEADRLQSLRKKAELESNDERWRDALATYTAALTIAPQAIFAVNGQREAGRRAELDAVLESILARPERLQEDGPLKEAQQALHYAGEISDPGPRLQGQIDRLSKMLVVATTPVTVLFNSDNETDVVIYRVGTLGRFLNKSVTLRPGTYSIAGSRQGYRDVMITVSVAPADEPVRFSIVCEEPI